MGEILAAEVQSANLSLIRFFRFGTKEMNGKQ
jgi:hypothetical protein